MEKDGSNQAGPREGNDGKGDMEMPTIAPPARGEVGVDEKDSPGDLLLPERLGRPQTEKKLLEEFEAEPHSEDLELPQFDWESFDCRACLRSCFPINEVAREYSLGLFKADGVISNSFGWVDKLLIGRRLQVSRWEYSLSLKEWPMLCWLTFLSKLACTRLSSLRLFTPFLGPQNKCTSAHLPSCL